MQNRKKNSKKNEDNSFSDFQNPLNDSQRAGLVAQDFIPAKTKSKKYLNNSNKGSNNSKHSQFDDMFDPNQVGEEQDSRSFRVGQLSMNFDNRRQSAFANGGTVLNKSLQEGLFRQKSSISQNVGSAVPQVQQDQDDGSQNIMVEGQLIENVNKRSETANRKYRAFMHFLKYQKNHPSDKKLYTGKDLDQKVGSDKKKGDFTETGPLEDNTVQLKLHQADELSQASDAEDDFDDRYIHLIAAHSEINKAKCVIYPDATGKGIWDLLGLLFIIYQAIMIPFRLCFDVSASGGLLYIEDVMDCCFMLDIIVTFNTGFYKKGYLVMKRKDIVKNYLKTWFLIDLVATFPYSWVMGMHDDNTEQDPNLIDDTKSNALYKTPQLLRLLKIIRFLRFLRLLRVLKLKKLLYKFEEIIMSDMLNAILGFLKVITVILFIAHWIACIFYAIGSAELDTEPICWIVMSNIQDAEIFDKYIISLYWAFTTMTTVGYGDVVPYTMSEKIYAMFSMLIACGVFAYVVGSIETIARRSNTMAAIFKEKILHVNQFLMHKQIPKYLRLKVRRYLEYMFEYKKQYKLSELEVLNMLNENLKDQVIVHLNGRMLKNTRIFGIFDMRFLSEVTFLLFNETFSMDDHIFEEDEKGTKMYFITKGTVVIMQKRSHTYIKELQIDEYFGEIAFFSELNRQATARSRGFTEVLSLNKESFLQTSELYPEAQKTYQDIYLKLTQENDFNSIFVTCYLCGGQGHISIKCESHFNEIEGNLKRQIYKYKQQLKLEQAKAKNDATLNKTPADIEEQDRPEKEEGEDSEEIKTDFSMYSEDEDDEMSSSSENSNSQQDKQSKHSRDVSKQGSTKGGKGLMLNINVGAKTAETAEKFIKKDQEMKKHQQQEKIPNSNSGTHSEQQQEDESQTNFERLGDYTTTTKNVAQKESEEKLRAQGGGIKDTFSNNLLVPDAKSKAQKLKSEVGQDAGPIMQPLPKVSQREKSVQQQQQIPLQVQQADPDTNRKKKIASTSNMLKMLEQPSVTSNQNSKPIQKNSSSAMQNMNQGGGSPRVKSILKNSSSIQKQEPSQAVPKYGLKKHTLSSDAYSSSVSIDSNDEDAKMPYSMNQHSSQRQETIKQHSIKSIKNQAQGNGRKDPQAKGSPKLVYGKQTSSEIGNMNSSTGPEKSKFSRMQQQSNADVGTLSKQKTNKKEIPQNEIHIENFIKSISPFKEFEPSFNRRESIRIAAIGGSDLHNQSLLHVRGDSASHGIQGDLASQKSIKRSGMRRSTTLLSHIKEEHRPEEPTVGVVPKDLTYDFLKDIIQEVEEEEKRKQNKGDAGMGAGLVGKNSLRKEKK